jgi:putative endonuclease
VASWYLQNGYAVLDRNWRRREGELDLVLGVGRTVVFCEVKTRTGNTFGEPFEAVDERKRRRLRRLAALWLEEQTRPMREVRFDVASVFWLPGGVPEVEVIQGAF